MTVSECNLASDLGDDMIRVLTNLLYCDESSLFNGLTVLVGFRQIRKQKQFIRSFLVNCVLIINILYPAGIPTVHS